MDLLWSYSQPDDFAVMAPLDRAASYEYFGGRVIAVQDFGVVVRVALPINLDTGRTVAIGVWIVIGSTAQVEWGLDDSLGECTFDGLLLNMLEPWPDVYDAKVVLEATPGPELARVVSTEHELLHRVLTEQWPEHVVRNPHQ